MTITVIVPTYRRCQDLARCLEALKQQSRLPDEVLVTVRDTDTETWNFFQTYAVGCLPLRTITISVPGVVAAMNAGIDNANGDIIAITDDDAEPHTDWLERLETFYLADERVGAVGGRDWVYHGTELEDGSKEIVGKVQWFGRVIGNHHIGVGKAREVDVIKGVNSSYRRVALTNLRFDARLRGSGAQIHNELGMCLALKQAGWKLIYDPQVAVNHYPGQRFDEDQRRKFNAIALSNIVHNETLILLENFAPLQRVVFLVWAVIVGTKEAPGLVQWLRLLHQEGSLSWLRCMASIHGRWQGLLSWLHYARKGETVVSQINQLRPFS